MATYPDSRYQQRPVYTSSPGTVIYPTKTSDAKYTPLKPKPSGNKVWCLIVFGLLVFGILFGLILAIICGATWKSGQWGYP